MKLLISRAHVAAIEAEARAAGRQECCGLLLGDPGICRVLDVRPAANVAAAPEHHFEIDPLVLLAAHKAARAGGPALLGHYHSHPYGSAEPSPTDAEMAEKRGEIWLIRGADGTLLAWRAALQGPLHGCFAPVEIVGLRG